MNKGKVSNWNNITVFIPEELGASAISSVLFRRYVPKSNMISNWSDKSLFVLLVDTSKKVVEELSLTE